MLYYRDLRRCCGAQGGGGDHYHLPLSPGKMHLLEAQTTQMKQKVNLNQYNILHLFCVFIWMYLFTDDSPSTQILQMQFFEYWLVCQCVSVCLGVFLYVCEAVFVCVCVFVWLPSSHVGHLLALQVTPPRADVVDASSHPAPSPVPRYYHTPH